MHVRILQLHIKSYLPFMLVILLLGSVVSILALMVISPTIAWIYLGLLIFLFALMCYENQKQLFPWIPKRIKNFFEFNRFRFRTICVVFFIYFHVNLFVQLRKKFNNVVCVYKMSYLWFCCIMYNVFCLLTLFWLMHGHIMSKYYV